MSNDDDNVHLLLEPINDGRILPIVRVENQVFMYDNDGLHSYPVAMIQHSAAWQKLGRTSLENVKNASAKAFELFMSDFSSYNPATSNPTQFMRALLRLFTGLREVIDWSDMSEQDWEGVKIDTTKIINRSSTASTSGGSGSGRSSGRTSGFGQSRRP